MSSSEPMPASQPLGFAVSPFDLDHCDTADLLGQLTDGATVVGLGEGAHFVTEFNHLRARTACELAARHGFTHLALEVGLDEAHLIESWLRGDRKDALGEIVGPLTQCLYGTFLLDLRDRLSASRDLRVMGVDLPNSLTITPSLEPLAHLLETIDPDALDLLDRARSLAANVTGGSAAASATAWMGLGRDVQDALTVALVRISGRIEALAPIHTGSSDEGSWRQAVQLARAASTTDLMLRAMAELFSGQGRMADTTVREQFIAAQILEGFARSQPGSRIIYVAHNNHIQKTPVVFDATLAAYPTGLFLARALGDRYVAVAATHKGPEVPEMTVPAETTLGFHVEMVPLETPGAGSVESAANEATTKPVGAVIVHPDVASPGSVESSIGSIRSQSAVSEASLDAFDAAIVLPLATMDPTVTHLVAR